MSRPWQIHHGDVRRICKTLEPTSFDAVLCDPPYGLRFMGRRWDYSVPSAMVWSEVERVMKPGAHAMIFGGSRTFHRLACSVEDAGFEIRDVLMWLYGSGFPKSLDVSKSIDDRLGHVREVTGTAGALWETWEKNAGGNGKPRSGLRRDKPASEIAGLWKGQGTALKPAYEPVLLVRRFPDGTVAETAIEWGTGGIDIDASRVGVVGGTADHDFDREKSNQVYGKNKSGQTEQLDAGRWPANIIFSHHSGCEQIGTRPSNDVVIKTRSTGKVVSMNRAMGGPNYGRSVVGTSHRPDEEVWNCVADCPIKILDEQAGDRPGMSGGGKHRKGYGGGMFGAIDSMHTARGDHGGPSRFFYTTKASPYQREAGCSDLKQKVAKGTDALRDHGRSEGQAGNHHPTVKPIDLIRYLARMILPPKRKTPRRILVPFSGSGSEMIGCLQAGWDEVVGIEREAEYIEIAKARITKGGVLSGLLDPRLKREREQALSRGRRVYGKFARDPE